MPTLLEQVSKKVDSTSTIPLQRKEQNLQGVIGSQDKDTSVWLKPWLALLFYYLTIKKIGIARLLADSTYDAWRWNGSTAE